jgi:protein-disulfide isomerase
LKKQFVLACATIIFAAIPPLAAQTQQNPAGNSAAGKSDASATPAGLSPSDKSTIQKNLEAYLRHMYAWNSSVALDLTRIEATPVDGLYKVTVSVTISGQTDSAPFYVSRDGQSMIRGEIENLAGDPLAEMRKQLEPTLENAPSRGPANAQLTIVEFGDFECPSCKAAEPGLRAVLPKYPQVRLVFKDFPLVNIHPWAMTASLAGRCVYDTNKDAFWKFHDIVYDNQELISPENAYQKLQDYAAEAGITDSAALRACMADPKTTDAIKASMLEGQRLRVANTPTLFINGRRYVGGDPAVIEQFLRFDLTPPPTTSPTPDPQ